MKINQLNPGYFYGLLNEANVLNVQKDFEYGREPEPGESRRKWSIEGYIESFLNLLGTDETKAIFAKKMKKLLSNDERFLAHVREMERGMPPWAEQAIKKKQLMFFEPEAALNQALEHISHYLGALETDMQSPDNNIATHAKKEYAAFEKAQDLQLLHKKSNDYFKRGSKRAGRSEDGMQQMAVYDGWKWFILKDAEAFKREGQMLQNCIGKSVTPASLKKDKMSLLVLRKPNGESVVAMSIKNTSSEVAELKGKNETTPLDKYMVYVQKFINDPKFKKDFGGFVIGSDAAWNFKSAGYFWIKKELLNRPEVIAKYIKSKTIATLPDKSTLVEILVASQNKSVQEIFEEVYKELKVCQGYGSNKDCATVYELRNDRNLPLVSGAVRKKVLDNIQRHATLHESARTLREAVNQLKGTAVREFVGELMRRKIITSVNDKMARNLFWNERVQINSKTGNFDPVNPSDKIEHKISKKNKVTWEKHTDDKVVAMIRKMFESHQSTGGGDRWADIFGATKTPKKGVTIYITKETLLDDEGQKHEDEGKHFALIKRADNLLVPVMIHSSGDRLKTSDTANAKDTYKRRHFIRSAAELANHENLDLVPAFTYNNGLVRDKGKYQEFDWKKRTKVIQESPEILKLDLEGIPPGDRMNAINFVLVTGNVRHRGLDELQKVNRDKDHDDIMWRHDLELQLKLDYLIDTGGKLDGYERGKSIWSQPSQEETNDWDGHNTDNFLRQIYHGSEPTAIYLVTVEFGKGKTHQALLIADGKTIFEIDAVTERTGFQNWGDHELVAKQLNEFAKEQGLTYHKEALGDIGEMKIHKGQVMTDPMIKRAAMSKPSAKTITGNEEEFKNGSKLTETKVKGGTGWAINDEDKFIGFIKVNSNTVEAVHGPSFNLATGKIDSDKAIISPDLVNYTIAAITHFGWTVKAISDYSIKKGSTQSKIIAAASEHEEVAHDSDVDHLVNLGLIKTRKITNKGRKDTKVQLTPYLGKQAHKQLETKSVNVLKLKSKMKII